MTVELPPLRAGLKEPASLRHTFSTPSSSRDQDLHVVDCHSPHTPASSSAFTTSMAPTARLLPTASLAHATSFAPASTLAATTSLAIASSQCDQPGSRGYPPAMLGSISSVQQMSILATPPSLGLQETDVVMMSCWMNKVALQLDDVLVDGVHVLAEPVEAPLAGSRQHQLGSPSARFQNLLIHARGRGTVPGFYEAMITRYAYKCSTHSRLVHQLLEHTSSQHMNLPTSRSSVASQIVMRLLSVSILWQSSVLRPMLAIVN